MSAIETIGLGFAVINCILALVLGAVYLRNHRTIRSPFTLGLLIFAVFLFVHNAIIVYSAYEVMMFSSGPDPRQVLIEESLQLAASISLVVATLR